MKRALVLTLALSVAAATQAVTITQWNFNSITPDGNTGTGTLTPNIGAGTAALIGGTTSTFASGDASGGSSDPAAGDDSAWNTTTYPAQGTGSGTAGVQFAVSTVGFSGITVMFDTRHSNTSSKYVRLDYSVDGGSNWIQSTTFEANAGDTWFNGRFADLSSDSAANNNASFMVRMVAVADQTGSYAASNPASSYGTTGTLRYDMVTISGAPVPEPASLAILGAGALALLRRRKK